MTTLFRYIFWRFARTILGVYALVFALILLVDLVEHLRRGADKDNIAIGDIVLMVFYHAPSLAEQVFPFAVLLGSMGSFLILSRTLELAVARAAGMSVWQFAAPGVAFAFVLGVFATTVYSPLAAQSRASYDRMNLELFGGRSSFMDMKRAGSWLRQRGADGETVIFAKNSADRGVVLTEVTAYVFDMSDNLLERIDAQSAVLRAGRWELTDARIFRPGETDATFDTYIVSSNLSPEQVREIFGSTESIAFWDLPDMIAASEAAGLLARDLRIQYYALLAQPLTFVAMVLVAANVSLRIFRFGNLVRMILAGVVAGFVLYVFMQITRDMGMSGAAAPAVASWLPASIAMLLSVTILLYQEDG